MMVTDEPGLAHLRTMEHCRGKEIAMNPCGRFYYVCQPRRLGNLLCFFAASLLGGKLRNATERELRPLGMDSLLRLPPRPEGHKIQTPTRKAGMVCLLGSLAFEKGCSHDSGKYRWPLLPHWMCTRGARRNQYDVSTDHPRDSVLIGWSRVTIPRSHPGPQSVGSVSARINFPMPSCC
jgi:hypothetical protein